MNDRRFLSSWGGYLLSAAAWLQVSLLCHTHGGGVATGHTPTPSHSRTIFRAGGGGGWVWGGEAGCQEGGGGRLHSLTNMA